MNLNFTSSNPPTNIFRIGSYGTDSNGDPVPTTNGNPLDKDTDFKVRYGRRNGDDSLVQNNFSTLVGNPGYLAFAGDKLYGAFPGGRSSTQIMQGIYLIEESGHTQIFDQSDAVDCIIGMLGVNVYCGKEIIPVLVCLCKYSWSTDPPFVTYLLPEEEHGPSFTMKGAGFSPTGSLTNSSSTIATAVSGSTLYFLNNLKVGEENLVITAWELEWNKECNKLTFNQKDSIPLDKGGYTQLVALRDPKDHTKVVFYSMKGAEIWEISASGKGKVLPLAKNPTFQDGTEITGISHYRNSGVFNFLFLTGPTSLGCINLNFKNSAGQFQVNNYGSGNPTWTENHLAPLVRPGGYQKSGLLYVTQQVDQEPETTFQIKEVNTSFSVWIFGKGGYENQFLLPSPHVLIPKFDSPKSNDLRMEVCLADSPSASTSNYFYYEPDNEGTPEEGKRLYTYHKVTDGSVTNARELKVIEPGHYEDPPHLLLDLGWAVGSSQGSGGGFIVILEAEIDPLVDTAIRYLVPQKGAFSSDDFPIHVEFQAAEGGSGSLQFTGEDKLNLNGKKLPIVMNLDKVKTGAVKGVPFTFKAAQKASVTLNCFFYNQINAGESKFCLGYYLDPAEGQHPEVILLDKDYFSANDLIRKDVVVTFNNSGRGNSIAISSVACEPLPLGFHSPRPSIQVKGKNMIVSGRVTDKSGNPQPHLTVIGMDKDCLLEDDHLGQTTTDQQGTFTLQFNENAHKHLLVLDRKPDIYFIVKEGEKTLLNTSDTPITNAQATTTPLDLKV